MSSMASIIASIVDPSRIKLSIWVTIFLQRSQATLLGFCTKGLTGLQYPRVTKPKMISNWDFMVLLAWSSLKKQEFTLNGTYKW